MTTKQMDFFSSLFWRSMEFSARLAGARDSFDNVGNRGWWEKNPMLYDWNGVHGAPTLNAGYFDKIDRIFGEGHKLLNNPDWPRGDILERFIPYQEVAGKDVLEIGCGAGLVASHLARNGARLVAVDITANAIGITRERFRLAGLKGALMQMEGESLALKDSSFDFVVSWGVIHHSGDMAAILREIHRVLKPGGRAHIMVYNRRSLRYQVYCRFWLGVIGMRLVNNNIDEIAGSITDGFIARHLTKREFRELASPFSRIDFSFSDESISTFTYLVGKFHKLLKPFPRLMAALERGLARRWGWYMEVNATK